MVRHRRHRPASALGLALLSLSLLASACSGGTDGSDAGGTGSGSTNAPGTTAPASSPTAAPIGSVATRPADPSPGCGASTAMAGIEQRHDLTIAGEARHYLRTIPTGHDGRTPLPLVVDFHGLSEGAQVHAQHSGYSAVAEREGFVVAFPHGRFQPVRWDANDKTDANADLQLFDAVLDEVGRDLCIDRSRVYATGLSYGAFMTSLVMCARSDKIAAAAPVAGIRLPEGGCTPARRVPILTYHGTQDPILLFNGGVGGLGFLTGGGGGAAASTTTTTKAPDLNGEGYPKNVAEWAAKNGCNPQVADTPVPTGRSTGQDTGTDQLIRRSYTCPDESPVELYIVVGGGHTWPGSPFSERIANIVGATTKRVDATAESWAFFRRFARP